MIGYSKIGSGKTIILLFSGWMSDCSVYKPLIDKIDLSLYTFYLIDYRGYGLSKNLEGNNSINEIASDAIELTRVLSLENINLIGHSMGGLVVQKIMSKIPERINKVMGLTPVPATGFKMNKEDEELFYGSIEDNEKRKIIIDLTTGYKRNQGWLNSMVLSSEKTTNKDAFARYLDAWTKTDIVEEIDGLSTKILVCVGDNDPAITIEMMNNTYAKYFKNYTVESIPNSGHYPMQENPDWLASKIKEYFVQ